MIPTVYTIGTILASVFVDISQIVKGCGKMSH
jgi:hypothetical protein